MRRPFIRLAVEGTSFLSSLRWATRVVEPRSSSKAVGALYPDSGIDLGNAEIVSLLQSFRSVTVLWAARSDADIGTLLKLLGGFESTPLLPRLRELHLRGWGWELKDLLEMVRARFIRPSLTCCPLTVKILSTKIHHLIFGPPVSLDDDTLGEIRSVKGVIKLTLE